MRLSDRLFVWSIPLLFAVTIIDVCDQTGATDSREAVRTNVCTIVRNPRRFDGKRVQFRASVLSDGRHGTLLVDSRCKVGIVLSLPDDIASHPDLIAFDEALSKGGPGTADKKIIATFAGMFRWKSTDETRVCLLDAEQISGLVVAARRR